MQCTVSSRQCKVVQARKMSCGVDNSAEEKFWNSSELLETLLPFLDASSTFNLAQSQYSPEKDSLFLGVLQRPLVWKRLIERVLPKSQDDSWEYQKNMLQVQKSTVVFLTEILKMMFNSQVSLEIDLLLWICKGFPPCMGDFNTKLQLVHVSHHLPPDQLWTHSVSPQGFTFLEMVESALGTKIQKIEKIQMQILKDPVLMALSERASRQGRRISESRLGRVWCYTKENAVALLALVRHSNNWEVCHLYVSGRVGLDGWNALREAVCSSGATNPLCVVNATLRSMAKARKEDLRAIWEVLKYTWSIADTEHGGNHYLCKDTRDKEDYNEMRWRRLERLVDLEREDMEKKDMEKEDLEKEDMEKNEMEKKYMETKYMEKKDMEKKGMEKKDLKKEDLERKYMKKKDMERKGMEKKDL